MPFLSFKGITNADLLKGSITHNKKQIPLLILLNNCISARSAPQILSIKVEYTFRFLNFQIIISLCNSSANSRVAKSKERWFVIFLCLIPLPEVFFIKKFVNH